MKRLIPVLAGVLLAFPAFAQPAAIPQSPTPAGVEPLSTAQSITTIESICVAYGAPGTRRSGPPATARSARDRGPDDLNMCAIARTLGDNGVSAARMWDRALLVTRAHDTPNRHYFPLRIDGLHNTAFRQPADSLYIHVGPGNVRGAPGSWYTYQWDGHVAYIKRRGHADIIRVEFGHPVVTSDDTVTYHNYRVVFNPTSNFRAAANWGTGTFTCTSHQHARNNADKTKEAVKWYIETALTNIGSHSVAGTIPQCPNWSSYTPPPAPSTPINDSDYYDE